ncbi:NAD(P)-binding protein [Thozetella sp. PMI_491]|nr:NAD(P)-binding protein [Thozetella sp. PMI_491]
MLSVAIWGATGYMGAPFSRALLKAHREGLLRFVILHRLEANLERYPEGVEKRLIDFDKDEVASIAEKVKDLQVVISAVSWRAHDSQYRLIDALKGSEQLVTFFPSEYATPHSAEDLTSPYFTNSQEKEKVREYCRVHNVPYTVLANATVPELLFNFGAFSSFDARKNKVELYWPLGDGTRGLTSKEFSGQALIYLLLHRLADLPNRSFSLVEIHFGARDLVAVFTKLHNGQEPTIVKYTEEDYQRDLHRDFLSAMGAASKKGVAVGAKWPGEIVSKFPGWQERTLDDYVKECLEAEPLNFETFKDSTDLSKD